MTGSNESTTVPERTILAYLITAKGTDLAESAVKEDPVDLDSSRTLPTRHSRGEESIRGSKAKGRRTTTLIWNCNWDTHVTEISRLGSSWSSINPQKQWCFKPEILG